MIVGQYYPKDVQVEKEVFTGPMRVVFGLVDALRTHSNIEIELSSKGLRRSKKISNNIQTAIKFLRRLLFSQAEIFHIHGAGLPMFLSLVMAKLKRKKTIYTAHGLVSREKRLGYHYSHFSLFFEPYLIKHSDHITTPSENMRKMIVRDYGVSDRKISVIENGVSSPFLNENTKLGEKLHQLQKIKDKHIILFVGGTRKVKNLPFLLKSIETLSKRRNDILLLIVGKKGDQHEVLMSEYSNLLQEGYVRVLGLVSEYELYHIYGTAEMVVLPSMYEPFGLVVLEAMAKGKVVIVSDRVGASSIITNKKDGVIVSHDNINQLAHEIDTLLSDKQKREEIGIDAKKTAKRYTWKLIAPKYVKCYTQVLFPVVPLVKNRNSRSFSLAGVELKSYYEKEAEYYEDHQNWLYSNVNPYRRYPHERRKILVDSSLKNATDFIDVGCGEGIYFKERNMPCVGIDVAKKYLLKARKRYSHAHFIVADACDLPFIDHAFGHLLCSEVLEHVVDWKRSIGELVRVAENVIVTVPISTIWVRLNSLRKNREESAFDMPGKGHINSFTYREFIEQLRANGLIIRKTKGVSWFPVWQIAKFGFPNIFLEYIKLVDRILGRFGLFNFMATTIIVVTERRY